jgi:hypothetical protein
VRALLLCALLGCGDDYSPPDAGAGATEVGGECPPFETWCAGGAGLCVLQRCLARCENACAPGTLPTWTWWYRDRLCLCVPQ